MGAPPIAEISFTLKTLGPQGTTLGAQDFLPKFRCEQYRVIEVFNKKDVLSAP